MGKLRVATIGAGYFSQFHHEAWAGMDEVDLVAVCDQDADKARNFAERWRIPAAYTEAGQMLEAEKPDILDIIAPPAAHLELIRLAAERGVPTAICQKAFCRSLAEAEEATRIAEDANLRLVVHENFRFEPWHGEVKRRIDAGLLGELYQVGFRLRPGDGQGPRAYLDRQPYFQKMERFLIHETAIHLIDVFRFFLGEVATVTARLARLNPVIAGEDAGYVIFEFQSGARALFDGNRLVDHPADNRRLTRGEMLVEGSAGVLRLDGFARLFHRAMGDNEERELSYEWSNVGFAGDSVRRLQRHVVEHLTRQAPVMNTARDYLANLRVEEAVYESASTGRTVALTP
ncbi:MAG TPA: Gfo/Idh/MocA family oxidoreductase [Aestuariivirgaceae bacterium]|nr:Gfo/Idh/MocA family oxidoreductase [Aestuariivirgaceae bacterium]